MAEKLNNVEETEEVKAESGFSKDAEIILSPTQLMIQKFKSNRLAMVGLWGFITIVTVVVVAHFYLAWTNYDFAATDPALKYMAPSMEHPFGTDQYGRDTFLRVLEGGWISLQVGVLSTLMSVVIGLTMGSIAGYFSGRVDAIIMRITEIVYSFPFLALAYTVAAIYRDRPAEERLMYTIFLLGLIRWTGLARMVRGQMLSLREQEFIIATKALGIKTRNQIMRHLIPNVLALVVVSATLTFAIAILGEASLSYLQLSVTEPVPTWGALLSKAAQNSFGLRQYWWTWVFPGTMLFLFIMSINLVGEGLRDATDPKAEYQTKKQRKAAKERKRAEKAAEKQKKLSEGAM